MRKKLFFLLLCLALVFGACSCNTSEPCSHVDADDNEACDKCGESFSDGCDNHSDANDDGICDATDCNAPYYDGKENAIDIIFIGNSYTYYGQTVLNKAQTVLTQEERRGDVGYFYQLCQANGMDVEVTNWTFGGHGLDDLFGKSCSANRGCDGVDHKSYLTSPYYDYVVIQSGSGAEADTSYLSYMEEIMSLFREANPDVKFVVLIPYSCYGTVGSSPYIQKNILNSLKTLATEEGVIVVDWGRIIIDILNGTTTVPGSTLEYVKNTFIISKSAKDGYHPNQLSGYITTLMTYCAITGESAVGQRYDFCNNSSLRPEGGSNYFYSFNSFISTYYKDGATTNYKNVFASATDMTALQGLVDSYLRSKAYMNYNMSGNEDFGAANGSGQGGSGGTEGTTPDSPTSDAEAIAQGKVAILENGGTKTYLTVSELEEKIAKYANGDRITLLTNVTCKGATSSNTGTSPIDIVFDLAAKTLTLTEGSILRARNNGIAVSFKLYSANGKGTLTLAHGNDSPAIIAYRESKTIVIGDENGYMDGDVVVINAASLLYLTARSGKDGANTTVTFWGGEYNQIASITDSYKFIEAHGRCDAGGSVYFAGKICFNNSKIIQKTASENAIFNSSFMTDSGTAQTYPVKATAVPGIVLLGCQIVGFSDNSRIHNMETRNSLITYIGCTITGDISTVGTDATDQGLGKVIIGEGTTFTAENAEFVKSYNEDDLSTFDGTKSGVYLEKDTALVPSQSGYTAVKHE